ncbi:MAG: guanylate kinase [Clostridiales bacterium]|nr:guanylate kinase [Clostridiales bacterium]MDU1041907.1 guanylate kinase [Clostridiales bacterium]MDU3491008.1 guanylate kinase [Clostridiales bacterium]
MNNKGLLIIISGYSGTGKGTVVKRLLEKYDERYALSISATTREPRDGEIDGREYFFKSKEEFEEMIANEELIEHACYVDNYYGTPKSYVEDRLNEGRNVILEIEIQGALKVKELFPDSVLIFLLPPSVEELEKRLRSRGTETDELVNARLARAVVESESVYNYDYIVINDDIEECVDTINGIIPVEKLRVSHQRSFIKKIEDDLKAYKA